MAKIVYRLIGSALLAASIASLAAQRTAAIRGVVRDVDGTPQLGVTVEVLQENTHVVANGFTDLNGRFLIGGLIPGVYQLRATAVLYVPALRQRLRLRPGDLPTINVTLSSLFEQGWPGASARHRGDLPDDWRWTLRSSSNRPLLRVFAETRTATATPIAPESTRSLAKVHRRGEVSRASGGFGQSGAVLDLEQQRTSGDHRLSTRFATTESRHEGVGVDVGAGLESEDKAKTARRLSVRVRTRPGICLGGRSGTAQLLEVDGAERIMVGDLAVIEAGSLLRVLRTEGTATASYPFLRVQAAVAPGWIAGYNAAASPEFQSLEDVGRSTRGLPGAGLVDGRLRLEQGSHQAAYVRRRLGRGDAEVALERESLDRVALTGQQTPFGKRSVAHPPADALVDASTGALESLHPGYTADGLRLSVSYPVGQDSMLTVQYVNGVALSAEAFGRRSSDLISPRRAQGARVVMRSTIHRSGTQLEAAYAWQPEDLVSVLSPFSLPGDGAFLSIHLRQPIRSGGLLPPGSMLTIDAVNLAKQGYVAVASSDPASSTALAATLRSLQAGLSFTF